MKNSKSLLPLVLGVTTLLVIVAIGYIVFNQLNNSQTEQLANNNQLTEVCYKEYTEEIPFENKQISFSYPCDWLTNVANKSSWSEVGTVVAPSGNASFHFPAPDMGLHGMDLVNEEIVSINENDYMAITYSVNGETLVFVDMSKDINQYGYGFMLAYKDSSYKDALYRILETIKF